MSIKKKLSIAFIAGCVLAVGLVVVWQPAKKLILQDSCLDSGGKWATNGNYCILRACAEDGSCKPSYNNNGVCSTLKLGISREELYFQLGMPKSNEGSVYTFTEGGAGSPIKATIINGVVSELQCGI